MKNTGSPLNPPITTEGSGKSGVGSTEHLDRIEVALGNPLKFFPFVQALESLTAIREQITGMRRTIEWVQAEKHSAQKAEEDVAANQESDAK